MIYMGDTITAHRLPCDLDVSFGMRNFLQDPRICTHPTSGPLRGHTASWVSTVFEKCGSSLFDADYILLGYMGKRRCRADL